MSVQPMVALTNGYKYCQLIGIELEGFSSRESSSDIPSVPGGHWEDDAGLNLCELITAPQGTIHQAFEVLRQLELLGGDIEFVPARPNHLLRNRGKWQNKERYRMVREALRQESPHTWLAVDQMTNAAALQVNISGNINPFGPDGVFLINVFNNIAPYFATAVHRETGLGKGHLSMWQKFARGERLPQAGRWFENPGSMRAYIESIPKLICSVGEGAYAVDLVRRLQVNEPADLGTLWWFLRAKRGELGSYLEFRFLPSMPLAMGEKYTKRVIGLVECLLDWFHENNLSQEVSTVHAVKPAYRFAAERFPGYVPRSPLSKKEWRRLLYQ